MHAELSIDEEGRAVLLLDAVSPAEYSMLERFRAFLPVSKDETAPFWRITGDRMPGMGNVKAQDATSKAV